MLEVGVALGSGNSKLRMAPENPTGELSVKDLLFVEPYMSDNSTNHVS